MLPSEEQIRTMAYQFWELRHREDGYDMADWIAAERNLTLWMNYEPIARYHLDERQKLYIGANANRRCRYCAKGEPQVSFTSKAHALPEAIGNKSLIANDECDVCNTFFSETIEDSFGKLLLPLRTMLGIKGKGGVPTYRSKDGLSRIEFDAIGNRLRVKEDGPTSLMREVADEKRLRSDLQSQRYVPIRVFKCLVKMAIAIMPQQELPHFIPAISWLLCPDDRVWLDRVRGAGLYYYFLPRFAHPPCATLMRRFTTDTPLPYMLFMIGVRGVLLQITVPLTHMNNLFAGQTVRVPQIGSGVLPGLGEVECVSVPLDSAEPVNATVFSFEQSYDSKTARAR